MDIEAFTFKSNDELQDTPGNMDSISLGQLRSMVGPPPKARTTQYAMRYEDEDTVFNEIEEFYSYVEVPQAAENLKAWQGSFQGEWVKTSQAQRKAHVNVLLESLEHRNGEIRFINARRLLYVLQGTFAETTSPEQHLHMIIENCKTVRAANGLNDIVEALKIASSKHDLLSSLSDVDTAHLGISVQDKQDSMEEVNTEVSVYLGMLYFLVEIFKGDDEFGDELMSLNPPLPVYLFGLVASMKEKSAKGYPVKKLLLLLWKSMLTCLGGIRELARAKHLTRELANLPPMEDTPEGGIKSSPVDFKTFRSETSVKYPTFTPQQAPPIPAEKIATALAPIPVRAHYHHPSNDNEEAMANMMLNMPQNRQQQQSAMPGPLPPTPAPSPPPNGKPKKQLYQTDPNRPFLFPFSRARGSHRRLVPFAIDEADKLYLRHMHVSLSLYQMWQTREACIMDESGVDTNTSVGAAMLDRRTSTALGSSADKHFRMSSPNDEDDSAEATLLDIKELDDAIAQADATIRRLDEEKSGDRALRRRTKERRDDLVRLRRVELLYVAVLPYLQSWVLVLLRLLLATVTASSANPLPPQGAQATSDAFPRPATDPPPPPPTLEEIDIMRHREITTKAVSAILLLTLKWFKVSHAMKFHHLSGLLLDANCLLLILKMFGVQEVSATVTSKNDDPDHNFFRYCYLNFAKNAQHRRPEDVMLGSPRNFASGPMVVAGSNVSLNQGAGGVPAEDEIEYITDYSWRNFFSSINFVKIMQKLSKGRAHRISMLVNYKSSAILKRILKVSHPMLQLHVLKLIKSQVQSCGRKWRQTNMKVITAIYLNCRPDLRDEWLAGNELEDANEALAQEHALRTLVKFYNIKRYGSIATGSLSHYHRRTTSQSINIPDNLGNTDLPNVNRPAPSPHIEADVFPPLRSRATDPSVFLPYIPEDIAFEEEYEDYLSDLGENSDPSHGVDGGWEPFSDNAVTSEDPKPSSAWQRIEDFANNISDNISDGESIVSIGELGDEGRNDESTLGDSSDENLNNWEHMSPKTFKALPKSPSSGGSGRRSSSGGLNLRPVIPFGLDDGSALDDDFDDDDDGPEPGPMLTGRTAPFAAGEGGKGVDEVEYMYGE